MTALRSAAGGSLVEPLVFITSILIADPEHRQREFLSQRLRERFLERLPVMCVPSPFEVGVVAFRESGVIEDDGGF
jgi:hypothetical protein